MIVVKVMWKYVTQNTEVISDICVTGWGICLVLACACVCIGYCEFLRQLELGVGDIFF